MTRYLIDAQHMCLDVPVFQPSARKLLSHPGRLLSDLYLTRAKRNAVTLLDDINLQLEPGDRVGIIGTNGAGKSTLLKVLAGVYPISRGSLAINGAAKGLFNISLGMNMEGTGLENIYLRGLQMGLTLDEVRDLVEEVVKFSELTEAIDRPINTYSTGMLLRLAFAISTMIHPDILLLDEWIGAGDIRFRQKAQDRMNELVDRSRCLVLATHNASLMKRLCPRGIVVDQGKIVFDGPIDDAQGYYEEKIVSTTPAASDLPKPIPRT